MSQLAILQTATEDQHDHRLGERAFDSVYGEFSIGDLVSVSDNPMLKRWRVLEVETYQPIDLGREVSSISLVTVALDNQPVPDRSTWWRFPCDNQYPYVVLDAEGQITQNMGIVNGEFSLPFPDLAHECYKPVASNAYPAIYLARQRALVAA